MLLQKARIGKTVVILISLTLLAILITMPMFLNADTTADSTPEASLLLPVVYNEFNLTPDLIPSATSAATATPTSSQTPTPSSTNTPENTPTSTPVTPAAADLIVGPPILISTPPIIVYDPVTFQVPITNTGDIGIDTLFFVDVLFNPPQGHPKDVYAAVSSLAGNNSITLTITADIGFANFVGTHQITGWVDSLDHILEADETNNLSEPLEVQIDNFGGTPTMTPTPNGDETISGVALILQSSLLPIERAAISLVDETSGDTIASTYSDENGAYSLENIPTATNYSAQACIFIDNQPYFGIATGVTAPTTATNIILQPQPCP